MTRSDDGYNFVKRHHVGTAVVENDSPEQKRARHEPSQEESRNVTDSVYPILWSFLFSSPAAQRK
jgi:hypothetical protein